MRLPEIRHCLGHSYAQKGNLTNQVVDVRYHAGWAPCVARCRLEHPLLARGLRNVQRNCRENSNVWSMAPARVPKLQARARADGTGARNTVTNNWHSAFWRTAYWYTYPLPR